MNWKKIGRGFAVVALCCGLLLTAACGERNGEASDNRALGRYVETEVKGPEASRYISFHELADGSVNLYLWGPDSESAIYNTRDFENWLPVEMKWHDKLTETEHLNGMTYDQQGQLFIQVIDTRDEELPSQPKLYKVTADGTGLEQIPVDWYQSPASFFSYVYANKVEFLDNGDFYVLQNFDDAICHYGSDGSYKGRFDIEGNVDYIVSGNTVTIIEDRNGCVKMYDGISRELVDQIDFENPDRYWHSLIFPGQDEAIYIQNTSGLYRLAKGGNLWEKLITGDLTSMVLPGLTFESCVAMANGDFYMTVSGGGESKILRYRFDPALATTPETELVVYTLEENYVVRQAVSEYHRLHPNTKINIEIVAQNDGTRPADWIRVLNTELLNGQGPDILILDGMNVDAYIDKGALADITGLVAELSADGNMVETVLRTFEKEGRILAVPTKYYMPVIIMDEEAAESVNTLADLVHYAQEHPEKGISGDMRPEVLFETLMPASAASWVNGNTIDTGKLAEFLEVLKALIDIDAPAYIYDAEEYGYSNSRSYQDEFHYAFGRTHTLLDIMGGIGHASMYHIDMQERGDGIVKYMPGQLEKAFIPDTIVGINVNSQQQEAAREFLRLLMSDAVQYDGRITGFAVSISAMEEEATYYADGDFAAGWVNSPPYIEGEYLYGEWAPIPFQQEIAQMAQGVLTPALLNDTLKNMIVEHSLGYLTGEKSLEQAIQDVEEATKLYLSE